MKRSEINQAIQQATLFFAQNGWALPPQPRWDVTDFGLGNFNEAGLLLVNLTEEPEYCEKLMYAVRHQHTPAHCHRKKKEDIICRTGVLAITLWKDHPAENSGGGYIGIKQNGELRTIASGTAIRLQAGERVTIPPGLWHAFYPASEACIIGEVSTANDDLNDNFFADPAIGRFSRIEEDEPPVVRLLSDAGQG
jgi:D-lyxose ketol-isomerase